MKQRFFFACGTAAPLFFLAALAIGRAGFPGYRPVYQSVSELISDGAPTRPVLGILFFACAILLILFSLGIYQSAKPTRNALGRGAAVLGALALTTISLLGILLLIFPMDPPGTATFWMDYSLAGKIHVILACGMSAGSLPAVLLVGWWLLGRQSSRMLALYTFISGALLFIAGSCAAVIYFDGQPLLGTFERLTFAIFFQWVMVTGGYFLGADGRNERTSRGGAWRSSIRGDGELLEHSNPALM